MALKLVLVGPKGTVFQDGNARKDLLAGLVGFIRRMDVKGVRVALWSRHVTTFNQSNNLSERVETYLSRESGVNVPFHQAGHGQLLNRQAKGSVDPILKMAGVSRREAILVGNEQADMQAGVNNGLLLVRPEWYPSKLDYGFAVESLVELAGFCELFGLRRHPIYWSIDQGDLRVRAMGPFSTMRPDFANFGSDARSAAKFGGGEQRFWFLMIVSSLYFSGLMHEVDYICPFPGHNPASPSAAKKGLDAVMSVLGRCFNKTYLPDLIVRHVASIKSQGLPAAQKTFSNHLNTLHLNRYPRTYDREPRKTPIQLRGKRVLVVDDICTAGRSLDTARAYIAAAGGTAILFSWLKTINTSFMHMDPTPSLAPFEVNVILREPASCALPYGQFIVDQAAPVEIGAALSAYKMWKET